MTFSEGFTIFLRLRRIVAVVSVLAGAGTYKFGPAVWHKVEGNTPPNPKATVTLSAAAAAPKSDSTVSSKPTASAPTDSGAATNDIAAKSSDCDLGTISLTNHYETCVSLGKGKACIFTPKVMDSHNVHLTLTVESKNADGKVHDLSITEVNAPVGKPLEIAVGGFSFSFTPNMTPE